MIHLTKINLTYISFQNIVQILARNKPLLQFRMQWHQLSNKMIQILPNDKRCDRISVKGSATPKITINLAYKADNAVDSASFPFRRFLRRASKAAGSDNLRSKE
uniref:CSON009316 protein n=1 Tax=Culicoides sonorensis TaxID=179676 RepID=A0A336MC19_CULSO